MSCAARQSIRRPAATVASVTAERRRQAARASLCPAVPPRLHHARARGAHAVPCHCHRLPVHHSTVRWLSARVLGRGAGGRVSVAPYPSRPPRRSARARHLLPTSPCQPSPSGRPPVSLATRANPTNEPACCLAVAPEKPPPRPASAAAAAPHLLRPAGTRWAFPRAARPEEDPSTPYGTPAAPD
jgi:hypothetical protein